MFVVLLWLVVSLIASFSSVPAGIALLGAGVIYACGEVWTEKRGDRHPTFTVLWWIVWRILFGAGVIAAGAIYLRWESILLFVFGAWSLALGGAVLAVLWRDRHKASTDSESP